MAWSEATKAFEAVAGRPLTPEEFDHWFLVVWDSIQRHDRRDWMGAVYEELRDVSLAQRRDQCWRCGSYEQTPARCSWCGAR